MASNDAPPPDGPGPGLGGPSPGDPDSFAGLRGVPPAELNELMTNLLAFVAGSAHGTERHGELPAALSAAGPLALGLQLQQLSAVASAGLDSDDEDGDADSAEAPAAVAATAAAEDEDASDSDEDSDEAEDMVLVDMKDSKYSATTQFVVKDSAGKVG